MWRTLSGEMKIHHDYCDIIILLFCFVLWQSVFGIGTLVPVNFARDRRERLRDFCLPDSHVLETCFGDVFGDVEPDQNPHGMMHD